MMRIRRSKGFSLIELLITIAIVGIFLAAVVTALMASKGGGASSGRMQATMYMPDGQKLSWRGNIGVRIKEGFAVLTLEDGRTVYLAPGLRIEELKD